MANLNIVLLEPEIPSNTGNIGRTCVATGTRLHLIEPLGFRLTEKNLRRAGMDYWKDLDVTTYINYEDFLEKNPGAKIYMATTKGPQVWRRQRRVRFTPMCIMSRTAISCSEKRAPASRRKSSWKIRSGPCGFP